LTDAYLAFYTVQDPNHFFGHVIAEVANTDETRAQGLSGRPYLLPSAGMLFIFEGVDYHPFTMQGVMLPLDMIFIDASRVVVGIVRMAQPGAPGSFSVEARALMVLEVQGGFAKLWDVRVGDCLRIFP
jgi:uncharacterized membrane protein (UPF0127 family)